jgi:hypothetical protein
MADLADHTLLNTIWLFPNPVGHEFVIHSSSLFFEYCLAERRRNFKFLLKLAQSGQTRICRNILPLSSRPILRSMASEISLEHRLQFMSVSLFSQGRMGLSPNLGQSIAMKMCC